MTPEQALRRIIEIEALPPDPLRATEWRRLHEIAFDARPGDAEARVFRELALRQALDLSEMLDDAGHEDCTVFLDGTCTCGLDDVFRQVGVLS